MLDLQDDQYCFGTRWWMRQLPMCAITRIVKGFLVAKARRQTNTTWGHKTWSRETVRLPTFHNKEKATLCRQLQDAKQGRDAAYAIVTALKKKRRDLEDKLRKSDCMVEESAHLTK